MGREEVRDVVLWPTACPLAQYSQAVYLPGSSVFSRTASSVWHWPLILGTGACGQRCACLGLPCPEWLPHRTWRL